MKHVSKLRKWESDGSRSCATDVTNDVTRMLVVSAFDLWNCGKFLLNFDATNHIIKFKGKEI
jgi:hypothetical protein